jgi:hypothetical protein
MRPDENGHEDLMKEAVSLVERIEFTIPGWLSPVVLGLNSQGWLFVYLGGDPMYRFDQLGRLRRALEQGYLYRTQGQTLAMLERKSSRNSPISVSRVESILVRRDLSRSELEQFRDRLVTTLRAVADNLRAEYITRQHPVDALDLPGKFREALTNVLNSPVFLAPAIVRR